MWHTQYHLPASTDNSNCTVTALQNPSEPIAKGLESAPEMESL